LFNLMFKRRFRFEFELIPYEATGLSGRKIANFFLAGLNQYVLPRRPLGRPVFAQVEPANFCNLSCPLCLTTSVTPSRRAVTLSFDTFKAFIDELGDYLLLIVLWNWGEPFLNPDLDRMIAYARARGILVHCSTNANVRLDEARIRELVESDLDTLIVGVDGVSEATYQKYRQGGSLAAVEDTIRRILDIRRRLGASRPRLNLRFVVMQHNEHELPLVEAKAREWGVDHLTLKTVDMPAVFGPDLDHRWAPDDVRFQRYEYEAGTRRRRARDFRCVRPWKRITLAADGAVVACEFDYRNDCPHGTFAPGASALSIWKSASAAAFRAAFNHGDNDSPFCRDCTLRSRVVEDCTVARIF
jgi:MoaA/NifB/PqqE/SkfB family radical SAM enzyme